jgi:uncharacterized membrane protein
MILTTGWFGCGIIATLLYGLFFFSLKIAAMHNAKLVHMTVCQNGAVVVCTIIAILVSHSSVCFHWSLVSLAAANATMFIGTQVARTLAMRHLSEAIVFPLSRLSLVGVALWSVCFLNEKIKVSDAIGMALCLVTLILLIPQGFTMQREMNQRWRGLFLVCLAALFGAVATIVLKHAVLLDISDNGFRTNANLSIMLHGYMILLLFGPVVTEALSRIDGHASTPLNRSHNVSLMSCLLGIISGTVLFIGFLFLLRALAGPLTIVSFMHSNAIIVPVVLGRIIYRSKVSLRMWLGVLSSTMATIAFAM